jgi:hypothetical protein
MFHWTSVKNCLYQTFKFTLYTIYESKSKLLVRGRDMRNLRVWQDVPQAFVLRYYDYLKMLYTSWTSSLSQHWHQREIDISLTCFFKFRIYDITIPTFSALYKLRVAQSNSLVAFDRQDSGTSFQSCPRTSAKWTRDRMALSLCIWRRALTMAERLTGLWPSAAIAILAWSSYGILDI